MTFPAHRPNSHARQWSLWALPCALMISTTGLASAAYSTLTTRPTTQDNKTGWKDYENAAAGFRMKLPPGWHKEPEENDPNGADFVFEGRSFLGAADLTMFGVQNSGRKDEEEFTRLVKQAPDRFGRPYDEWRTLEADQIEIAGQPARRFVFSGRRKKTGVPVKLMVAFVRDQNGKMYYFLATSSPYLFDQRRSTIDGMVNSFEFMAN